MITKISTKVVIEIIIRRYMGRHLITILEKDPIGKKAYINHEENGYVGNKREGYRNVEKNAKDVVLLRHCYNLKFDENNKEIRK